MIARLRDMLRALVFRRRFEAEMSEEFRFHIEQAAEDLVRRGVPRVEALRRARAGFGSVEGARDEAREARGIRWADELRGDLRYAVRTLKRSPGFAAVSVLTLALGIGANTTIFSVINGVLLRPLPFPESNRLVHIAEEYPLGALPIYRAQAASYHGVAAFLSGSEVNLFSTGRPERVLGRAVSAEFFSVLGVGTALGRTFRTGEDAPGAAPVAVISYGLWTRRFGGDPDVVGKPIIVNGATRQIIGVAPLGFAFPVAGTEIWTPVDLDPRNVGELWGAMNAAYFGRLRPQVSLERADDEHRALITRVRDAFPWRMPDRWATGTDNHVTRLEDLMAAGVRSRLRLLFGAVGLVLLVACANVANLNLTRLAGRQREILVRQALGGGRWRIARQLFVEQLLLAGLGGAAGVALALIGTPLLVGWLPADTPRLDGVRIDAVVLGFTGLVSILAGLLAALGPMLRVPRAERLEGLGLRTAGSGRALGPLSNALVVAEIALAVVLLMGAGLLVRSLGRLLSVDPGVRVEHLVTARVTPDPDKCDGDIGPCATFYANLTRELAAIPGLSAVEFSSMVPLDGQSLWWPMDVEDHPVPPGGAANGLTPHTVTPGYFAMMGIRVERGRALSIDDRSGADPVVVIGKAAADHYWPGQSPIGKHIKPVWVPRRATIVGVVSDVREYGLAREPELDFYMPIEQWAAGAMTMVVRTERKAGALESELKQALAKVDPTAPLSRLQSMDQVVQRSIASPRTTTLLLAGFAAVALLLGAIGVYGVLSYGVTQRRREIGIRMAIGAAPGDVRWTVVRRAAGLVAAGLLIGLGASWLGASALRGFVFGVGVRDGLTFVTVPLVFLVAGFLASYLPARRATLVAPREVLQGE
ncbi:MAG TPA: ABC transporter permease [Gemmatimonadales bacterium]|nr:ABC transporter permease [Gemmatimonadales bacterium]